MDLPTSSHDAQSHWKFSLFVGKIRSRARLHSLPASVQPNSIYEDGSDDLINADSQAVLRQYDASLLYERRTRYDKLRADLRTGRLSVMLEFVSFIASFVALVLFVMSTYYMTTPKWMSVLETVIGVLFLVDYLLRLFRADPRPAYILSSQGWLDLVTVLPLFLSLFNSLFLRGFALIRLSSSLPRMLTLMRTARAFRVFSFAGSSVTTNASLERQKWLLIASVVSIVFVTAAIFQQLQRAFPPEGSTCWQAKQNDTMYTTLPLQQAKELGLNGHMEIDQCISFTEAVYFVIVTMSTVGYGDFVPYNVWSRLLVSVAILAFVIIVPVRITKLIEIRNQKVYGGMFIPVNKSRYVILSGDVGYNEARTYLYELFFRSHVPSSKIKSTVVVLLIPAKPSLDMQLLLNAYNGQVKYFEGCTTNSSDLVRVSAHKAAAIFVVGCRTAARAREMEDSISLMRGMGCLEHRGRNTMIYVQVFGPDILTSSIWGASQNAMHAVCPTEIGLMLMARSCFVKGITPFLTNLFVSADDVDFTEQPAGSWLAEYVHGMTHKVYPVVFSPVLHGMPFLAVANILYKRYSVVLFGLDSASSGHRNIIISPLDHIIEGSDLGLVIADSLSSAQRASRHRPSTESKMGMLDNIAASRDASFSVGGENIHGVLESPRAVTSVEANCVEAAQRQFQRQESIRRVDIHDSQLRGVKSALAKHHAGNATPAETAARVAEVSLRWPPALNMGHRPSYAIIQANADSILKHLTDHSCSVVDFNDHILIACEGANPDLFYLMGHLRSHRAPQKKIVLLQPEVPTLEQWGCLGVHADVFYICGSSKDARDLARAGAAYAHSVVFPSRPDHNAGGELDVFGADADVIQAVWAAEKVVGVSPHRIQLQVEDASAMHLLGPHAKEKVKFLNKATTFSKPLMERFQTLPIYAQGKALCTPTLDFLMYHSLFNPHTVEVVTELILGSNEPGCTPCLLDQVPVILECVTYGQLFAVLLIQRRTLALGLYRAAQPNSHAPYVYTNPPAETLLRKDDLVYVLR
eukprot:jgi/Chlat1/4555/Chrsp29S00338